MKTSCEKCIFRINDEFGMQYSCKLGRLEKFKDKGEIDSVNVYYTINGLCNTCRDGTQNYTNPEEQVLKEVEIKYDAIIPVTNFITYEDDILKSVMIAASQSIQPVLIHVCISSSLEYNMVELHNKIRLLTKSKVLLTKCLDNNLDIKEVIDHAIEKTLSVNYLTIIPNCELPYDYVEYFNNKLSLDLEKYLCMIYKDNHGILCPVKLHKLLAGNQTISLIEKLHTHFEDHICKYQLS